MPASFSRQNDTGLLARVTLSVGKTVDVVLARIPQISQEKYLPNLHINPFGNI